ncbi:MAG: hypothetical protein ACTH0R_07515 [Canibacter sp.]
MIGTILKHEFLRTIKPMLIIVGIMTLLILLGASAGLIMSQLGIAFAAMGLVILPTVIQWYLGIDFYISSYAGSGATLTHTLPISGRMLYWSKLLYALIVSLVFWVVIIGILWLIVAVGVNEPELNGFFTTLFTTPGYLVFFGLVALLGFASIPITLFFSAVIGSGGWARRLGVGGPVIVYAAVYIATQLVAVAVMWLPPGVDLETGKFTSQVNILETDATVPLSVFFLQLVAMVVMVLWAARDMNKKVQLS